MARSVRALVAMLKSEDLGTKMEAALELGRLRARKAVPALLEALGDGDISVLACWALGRIGDKKAVGRLAVLLLSGKAAEERHEAALALGRLGDEKAVKPLLSALRKDKVAKVREECAEALAGLGSPEVISALAKAAETDKSDIVRMQAARSLAQLRLR